MKSLVIIPTYNEKDNIEPIIKAIFEQQPDINILVVDDGSPDGTAAIVQNLKSEFPQSIFLLERAGKQGLGTAYLDGFKWGKEKEYEYFFERKAKSFREHRFV